MLAYGSVPSPLSMYEEVREIEPGTWNRIDLRAPLGAGAMRTERYWAPRTRAPHASTKVVVEELRPRLREAVESHLVSDVRVGVFLSSGIDSTVVAGLASRARQGDVDLFTVAMRGDEAIDEVPVAERTAAALGARHQAIHVSEEEALKLAQQWLRSLDQPSIDGLNTFIVSHAVRQRGIVVALSGLGGDEVFGGYSSFYEVPIMARLARAAARIPEPLRFALVEQVAARWPNRQYRKLLDVIARPPSLANAYFQRRRLLSDADLEALGVSGQAGLDVNGMPLESMAGAPSDSGDDWSTVRALEMRYYMRNTLLRDADTCGMAHGLEIRVPLLDQRVVDCALDHSRFWPYAARRPNKPWLVSAAREVIPDEVLRLPKRGFSLPYARWLRGPLRDMMFAHVETVRRSGALEPARVTAIWERFLREPASSTVWSRAWMLAVLGAWLSSSSSPPTSAVRAVSQLN
jgi:asparagine synthase (glutamine-hydrolysing)